MPEEEREIRHIIRESKVSVDQIIVALLTLEIEADFPFAGPVPAAVGKRRKMPTDQYEQLAAS